MENNQILLETKLVSDIEGTFFVPSYQRGYRWGEDEVRRLLNDIYANGEQNYCLQPIVVRKNDTSYELIDGQQRLTTLYLIYKYMHDSSGGFLDEPKFELIYETRAKSKDFLKAIDMSRKEENIDFWFICNAYDTISHWFAGKDKKSTLTDINKFFDKNVKVIWYEVDESQDAISLFTRLNIGKIPLTSAELVKAMFLNGNNIDMDETRQIEISLQWDDIEKELHNDSLWYFLTNYTDASYQTRIDLILDLIADKPEDTREKYYTFFEIYKRSKTMTLIELWREIQQKFLLLKHWHENHELYHKIGYLIASEKMTLRDIFKLSIDKTKQDFKSLLDSRIRQSIEVRGNYADMSYENAPEYKRISTLLLLFNVESVRQNGEHTQWFPFDRFKFSRKGRVSWSLEHIHALQSEGLRTQEMWKEWLTLHIPSVRAVSADGELADAMQTAVDKASLERTEFENLQRQVIEILSLQGSLEYLHSISNLALLKSDDNAALNNSTFDVKRNLIVNMDKEGQYIPFCTKMVFLKYYTPSEDSQLHFWGQADRIAYINAINRVLAAYLPEPIAIMEEV